jgi:tetratricopeptide (TPR) repeat protein
MKHLDDETLTSVLREAETWEPIPVPPAAPRPQVSAVAQFAARIREEDERAGALCDEILVGPSTWWRQRLRKTDGANSAGMVKQLLERMRSMLETAPVNALQVTALAVEIANDLDVAEYPCDYAIKLRAQAHRDHAYVLSFLGRYPEALEFAARSKRLFDQTPLPEYDLARLALVKALILPNVDRHDEAAALAREAGDTFLRFGDRPRYVNARISEGSVVYQSGQVQRALEIWKSVEHDPSMDDASAVRVAHNIALCFSDLQKPAEAVPYVQRCVAEFELLGMDTERTRSRWMLAHALVALGKTEEAIPSLRQAWREFERLEMTGDSALVALELAESLLALGQAEEVPSICREVIAQFSRTGVASRAMTALSFLREAVAIGQASPSLIRHVHAFLRELPAEQPRLFAPPPAGLGE